MLTLLALVHVFVGLAMILFVLLQDPKGGAMGVFSGGGSSSNSFFGSTGASNFLTTTTKWLAITFAITSLTLTYMTAKKGGSVMDGFTPPAATAPATDAAAPAATDAPAAAPVTPPPAETK